jgi:hypothetical protein
MAALAPGHSVGLFKPKYVKQTAENNPMGAVTVGYGWNAAPFCAPGIDPTRPGIVSCLVGEGSDFFFQSTVMFFNNSGNSTVAEFEPDCTQAACAMINPPGSCLHAAPTCGNIACSSIIIGTMVVGTTSMVSTYTIKGNDTERSHALQMGWNHPNDDSPSFQLKKENLTSQTFSWATGTAPSEPSPWCGDLDSDGDFDCVFGNSDGTIHYQKNVGSDASSRFVEQTGAANPLDVVNVGANSAPSCSVDIDGDGLQDCVVGTHRGEISFFKNTGTPVAPNFTQQFGYANPFHGIDVGSNSKPSCADFDYDGGLFCTVMS